MFTRLSKTALVFATATLLLASPALAQNVGIINVQKIMAASKAAQSIRTQLEAKQKGFQADLNAKQSQFQAEDQALKTQEGKLAKEAFEKKVKDFQAKFNAAQQEIQTKKEQLDKAFTAALNQIQEKVVAISKSVAEEKELDLVISSSQVLYGKPELDITDAVLKNLDSALPSVQVKF
jgi:outer membrane protein